MKHLELRAQDLAEGDVYREYGMDEWVPVFWVDRNMDKIWVKDPDDHDHFLDIDDVLEVVRP